MRRVAIIGGGLSGLSAACQLARESFAREYHVQFTLFEASERLGGIVETVHQDGFVVECGPDSWVTEKPWARELAIELGLEAEIIPSNDQSRRTYLFRQNHLVPMPDGMRMMVPTQLAPVMESPLFSDHARLAFQREPARAEDLKFSALGENQDESVAAFVRRHFGDEVTRTIAGPLLAGVFGGDIDRLSVRAVMPAFVEMEREHGSLIAALQSKPSEATSSVFTTLRPGLCALIDRIAAALPSGCIQLSSEVSGLERTSEVWHVQVAGSSQLFDAVVIATPAHVTRKLLRPVHQEIANLLAVDSTSAIVVALAFTPQQSRQLSIPPGFGYLVPQQRDTDSQLLACTFVNQKFPHRVPEGATLLRAFFGGDAAASLLNADDDTLTALALEQLSLTLGPLPAPHFSVVRRWPFSLPQYEVGHLDRMAKLRTLLADLAGLYLVGNAYYGVGLPDMVRMGRDAARHAANP